MDDQEVPDLEERDEQEPPVHLDLRLLPTVAAKRTLKAS